MHLTTNFLRFSRGNHKWLKENRLLAGVRRAGVWQSTSRWTPLPASSAEGFGVRERKAGSSPELLDPPVAKFLGSVPDDVAVTNLPCKVCEAILTVINFPCKVCEAILFHDWGFV